MTVKEFELENYEPKGELTGFPKEIITRMLECQEEQGNKRNVSVFEERISAECTYKGFDWNRTKEAELFWFKVIKEKNFDFFFKRYPKKEDNQNFRVEDKVYDITLGEIKFKGKRGDNMDKKNNRKKVYDKFNGKCAYCGCDITLEKMQIDHLVPLYRNDIDKQLNKWGKIRGTDEIENLMPSCPSCNHYKSVFSLEMFREQLSLLRGRLNDTSVIYNISKRYGLIDEKENIIEFYFEKII